MDKDRKEYRQYLVAARQKSFEDYDKTVLALSGAALGISITFVKDLLTPERVAFKWILLISWGLWAISVTSILASYFSSQKALDRAIKQIDDGRQDVVLGGRFLCFTKIMNILAGFGFLAGLLAFMIFILTNMEAIHGNKPEAINKQIHEETER